MLVFLTTDPPAAMLRSSASVSETVWVWALARVVVRATSVGLTKSAPSSVIEWLCPSTMLDVYVWDIGVGGGGCSAGAAMSMGCCGGGLGGAAGVLRSKVTVPGESSLHAVRKRAAGMLTTAMSSFLLNARRSMVASLGPPPPRLCAIGWPGSP